MHSNTQQERKATMQCVFRRIELRPNWIRFEIDKAGMVEWLVGRRGNHLCAMERQSPISRGRCSRHPYRRPSDLNEAAWR